MTQRVEHVHGAAMSAAYHAHQGARPEMNSESAIAAAFARAAAFGAVIFVGGKQRAVADPLPLVRTVAAGVRSGSVIAAKVAFSNALHRQGRPFSITAPQLKAIAAWLSGERRDAPKNPHKKSRRAAVLSSAIASSKTFRDMNEKKRAAAVERREKQRDANERTRAENAAWRAEDFAGRARL